MVARTKKSTTSKPQKATPKNSNWGGKRDGAGRMKKYATPEERPKKYSVAISAEAAAYLEGMKGKREFVSALIIKACRRKKDS